MVRDVKDEAVVAGIYGSAREARADEDTAFELARQCYDDLWPGLPPDQVTAEVERIVSPVRQAIATGQPWRPTHPPRIPS